MILPTLRLSCVALPASLLMLAGCGPDHPEAFTSISSQGTSPDSVATEPSQYRTEPRRAAKPNDEDNPCGVVIDEARYDFGRVYEIARRPRLAILANVLSTNLGGRDDDQSRASTAVSFSDPEAVPVDRATVENECIAFFDSTTHRMKLVDVAVARTSMASARNEAGVLEGFRRIDLCDIGIMIEVRAARVEPTNANPSNPERYSIACTGRAVNVRDGRVLATASIERRIAGSEQALDNGLRKVALCLAAELSTQIGDKLTRPAP